MTNLPAPKDVARMTGLLREHPQWSVFWDPKYHLWRAAEDDPKSNLYAESPDAATITDTSPRTPDSHASECHFLHVSDGAGRWPVRL